MHETALSSPQWDTRSDGPPFTLHRPAELHLPMVLNSPHSGRQYPTDFIARSRLTKEGIRRSEDCYVDELVSPMAAAGAAVLTANFPRAYLDVNREPYELDPTMFDGELPPYANRQSQRVASGLGTIARIVAENQEIYRQKIALNDGLERIEMLYKPYHGALRRALAETHVRFGFAILVDCHSMPSVDQNRRRSERPDIILGDRFGSSCAGALTDHLAQAFADCGYSVTRNKPYAGGFITHHYGRPLKGLHAVQIEINRGLYMNELTYQRLPAFAELQHNLCSVIGGLSTLTFGDNAEDLLAAE